MQTLSANSSQDSSSNPPHNFPQHKSSLGWGLLMVAAGCIFMVQQLGFLIGLSNMLWTALFGVASVAFLLFFLSGPRDKWWAAIPGFTLGGLATVTLLEQFDLSALNALSGPVFLGSIGMAFAVIFLFNPDKWWALIPGGVMLTLAVVAYVDQLDTSIEPGSILFLGFGLTFAAIGLLPAPDGNNRRWAFIPAAVLSGMGLLIGLSMDSFASYLWPLALIGGGLIVVYRSMTKQ